MTFQYDKNYYDNYCGPISYSSEHFKQFFDQIAEHIVNDLHPKTVLDAGCAYGYLVTALRDRGVEAFGIDISEHAISKVRDDIRQYCEIQSLTEKLTNNFPDRYDLVISIEVLEHMYEDEGKIAIKNIVSYSDRILFSSSPDDLKEKSHVNVQQREYWAKLFAEYGFYDDIMYRPTYISPQSIYFRRTNNIIKIIEDFERELRQSWNINIELKNSLNELHDKYKNLQDKYNNADNITIKQILKHYIKKIK